MRGGPQGPAATARTLSGREPAPSRQPSGQTGGPARDSTRDRNWRCATARRSAWPCQLAGYRGRLSCGRAWEFAFDSDAHVTGEGVGGLRPYRLINAVPHPDQSPPRLVPAEAEGVVVGVEIVPPVRLLAGLDLVAAGAEGQPWGSARSTSSSVTWNCCGRSAEGQSGAT